MKYEMCGNNRGRRECDQKIRVGEVYCSELCDRIDHLEIALRPAFQAMTIMQSWAVRDTLETIYSELRERITDPDDSLAVDEDRLASDEYIGDEDTRREGKR